MQASVVVARGLSSCDSWALERRLSSCGARAQLLRGMWDLPGPGLEPVSPALAAGFLTTAPPGKPTLKIFEACYQTLLENICAHVCSQHSEGSHCLTLLPTLRIKVLYFCQPDRQEKDHCLVVYVRISLTI